MPSAPPSLRLRARLIVVAWAALAIAAALLTACGRIGYEDVSQPGQEGGPGDMDLRPDEQVPGDGSAGADGNLGGAGGTMTDAAGAGGAGGTMTDAAGVDGAGDLGGAGGIAIDAGPDRIEVSGGPVDSADLSLPVDVAAPADLPPDTGPVIGDCDSPTIPAAALIASFNDGTVTLAMVGDRGGTLFTAVNDDGASVQAVASPPDCPGRRVMLYQGPAVAAGTPRVVQGRFKLSNTAIGRFHDARPFRGISFHLRASSPLVYRVKVSDRNTSVSGGICSACSDHFQTSLNATTTWSSYTVRFSDLRQSGVGDSFPALDVSNLYALEFSANGTAAFQIWIDDIAFID
jgi:hypothetical protein